MKSPTLRAFLNGWLIAGIVLLLLGTGPLLLGAVGLLEIGNGVGPGVTHFVTFLPSIVLIVIGCYVAIARLMKEDGGAA